MRNTFDNVCTLARFDPLHSLQNTCPHTVIDEFTPGHTSRKHMTCVESPRHQNKRWTRPFMERLYLYSSNRLSKQLIATAQPLHPMLLTTPCTRISRSTLMNAKGYYYTQSTHPAIYHARNHETLDLLPLKLLSLTSHEVQTTEWNQKCRSPVQTSCQETL